MKNLNKILFLFVILFSSMTNVYAEDKISYNVTKSNTTLTISYDVKNEGIYGMNTSIEFDPEKLTFNRCVSSNFEISTNIDNKLIVVAEKASVVSNSNIVTCMFQIKNSDTLITLNNISFSNSEKRLEEILLSKDIRLSEVAYVPDTAKNNSAIQIVIGILVIVIGLIIIFNKESNPLKIISVLLLVLIPLNVLAEDYSDNDLNNIRNILLLKTPIPETLGKLDADGDSKLSINDLIIIKLKLFTPEINFHTTTSGPSNKLTSATTTIELDNTSELSSAKYCITTGAECTPNQSIEIKNKISINFPSNPSKQRLCFSITTKEGKTVSKCDENQYLVYTGVMPSTTPIDNYNIPVVATGEKQVLKVLVIEINPVLHTVQGTPKVSDYFGQNPDRVLSEMKNDLEQTSHNYLSVKTTREYLNEFPTYKGTVLLRNGNTAHSFDEQTYLYYAGHTGGSTGNWFKLLENEIFSKVTAYSFDYDYIINKYNLIQKRNNKEFDQVWLLTIDPAQTYETMMVGNNAYWINGSPKQAECQNFIIANISISRRDANLHAVGHGVEGIMSDAFSNNKTYIQNSYNINSTSAYNNLDLWTKFTLGDYSNQGSFTGVGNVHYPFNGTSDYDYSNTNKVLSNWREWENYPNITGNFKTSNNSAWMSHSINSMLSADDNIDPDRLFMRFWFNLFPHHTGYTKDGYSNNWWTYFYSLDKVSSITCPESINVSVGSTITNLTETEQYASRKTNRISLTKYQTNITIKNKELFGIDASGNMIPIAVGNTQITYYRDGVSCTTNVTIE